MHDYYYLFLHGNDTINRVANTELFKKLTFLFDGRALPPPSHVPPPMNISNETNSTTSEEIYDESYTGIGPTPTT
jgi:hypothetical protein